MQIKSIKQVRNLEGKRVLVRVDFNVSVKDGKVMNDYKFKATLPTLEFLLEKKAKLILMSHLGRPKGKVMPALRVTPLVRHLSKLLGKKIKKLPVSTGKQVVSVIEKMKPGSVLFLENIQFDPGEGAKDPKFVQTLASYCDYFVLDAFGQSHRDYASIAGIQAYAKSYAGLLLEQEIKGLSKVTQKPKKPFVVVLGGVKIETKIPVMKNLIPKASKILIGGGLVNTYLKAKGYKVGDSLVDDEFKKEALNYCRQKKVIKPLDVVVGTKEGKHFRVVELGHRPHHVCKKGEGIFDIGPETIQLYAKHIKKAQTIVWNGAMGYFEQKPYDVGTLAIARLVASRSKGKAYGVIGGGETLQSMEMVGMMENVDLVSTGGGAMLEYLSGKKLPGIVALEKK